MKRVEIQFSLFLPRREKTITKLEVGSRERIQQLEITGEHLGRTRIKQIKRNLRLGTTIGALCKNQPRTATEMKR
jgi:hypothetical protein